MLFRFFNIYQGYNYRKCLLMLVDNKGEMLQPAKSKWQRLR